MATLKEEEEVSPTDASNQKHSSPAPQCSIRSPNGTVKSTDRPSYNTSSPVSTKQPGVASDQAEDSAKSKLLQDENGCVDSSVDARESDALLKH